MFKTRTRMVSFRVSEDEYERLKDLSLTERARSVSEFARAALCKMPDGRGDSANSTGPRVDRLEGAVQQLTHDMHHLRQLVEESLGRISERVAAAGFQENSQ